MSEVPMKRKEFDWTGENCEPFSFAETLAQDYNERIEWALKAVAGILHEGDKITVNGILYKRKKRGLAEIEWPMVPAA